MIRINLAPPSAKKAFAVPDFNLGMLFGVLALGLVLILGGWWWSVTAEIRRLNNEIAENKKQAEQLKVVIAESQRFQRDKEALERRVNAIEVVARQATRPVYLLGAVADQLPKDLWLNRMEEKGTQLKLRAPPTAPPPFPTSCPTSRRAESSGTSISSTPSRTSPSRHA